MCCPVFHHADAFQTKTSTSTGFLSGNGGAGAIGVHPPTGVRPDAKPTISHDVVHLTGAISGKKCGAKITALPQSGDAQHWKVSSQLIPPNETGENVLGTLAPPATANPLTSATVGGSLSPNGLVIQSAVFVYDDA